MSILKSIFLWFSICFGILILLSIDYETGFFEFSKRGFPKQTYTDKLRQSPLTYSVFLEVLDDPKRKGLTSEMRKNLLEMVFRRNPRNRTGLTLKLKAALYNQDFENAVLYADLLMTLRPSERENYFPLLDIIVTSDRGYKAVKNRIANNRTWSFTYLAHSIETTDKEAWPTLRSAIEEFESSRSGFDSRKHLNVRHANRVDTLKRRYLFSGVKLDWSEDSYNIWLNWYGNAEGAYQIVQDPNFEAHWKPTPFTWSMTNGKDVNAESDNGDLFVSFNGNQDRSVATQIIKLKDNADLSLIAKAKWNYSRNDGYFEWRLRCLADLKMLAALKIQDSIQGQNTLTVNLNNENSCTFARLSLWAVSGQRLQRISARISQVDIIQKK